MTLNGDWLDLLEEFRRLGGTADNICLRNGNFGRGVFPVDPSLPVLVRVPQNLLLPVEEATFQGNKFHVDRKSRMGSAEKAWLEHYMDNYSWGGSGQTDVEHSLMELLELPEALREFLASSFSIFYPAELSNEVIQTRFLHSRIIDYDNHKVVMPIVELINHGPFSTYDCSNGVVVGGTFADEVLVRYGSYDTLGLYRVWGFVAQEKFAISLPGHFNTELGEIVLNDEMRGAEPLQIADADVVIPIPKLTRTEDKITLTFLALGWKGLPRVPKGIFRRLLREAGLPIADETFEVIQYANRLRFLELLGELDKVGELPAARGLRTMCRYQLEALAQSYGVREL